MDSTKQQLLRNADITPTDDVIASALGASNNAFVKFLDGLAEHEIRLEWRYYTDVRSWLGKGLHEWMGARGGKKALTVIWLSVWDGFFNVSLYLPEKARADALALPLDDAVKQKIADSKTMGKTTKYFPLIFELDSDEMLEAIFVLADFKKSLK